MKYLYLWLLFLLAFVLVMSAAFMTATTKTTTKKIETHLQVPSVDPRIENLTRFFDHYHGSTAYINDYLNAADKNQIDYRLLPAISIAESSGGKHACGFNWWGWNSCKGDNFSSVAQGIQFVSGQLANGHYYKGKTIEQKLHAYNPNVEYASKIIGFMKDISNE